MERFLTTPLEEREKFEQTNSLNARLSSNQAVIAKLEKELHDATAERDAEVSPKITSVLFACRNQRFEVPPSVAQLDSLARLSVPICP